VAFSSLTALAQNPTQTPPPASTQPSAPAPTAAKPRIFLQAQSRGNTFNAARDQSMEMSKDFDEVCPAVRITLSQQMADYTVSLNHLELGLLVRDNQFQLADRDGDLLSKAESGSIRGGVKRICDSILADWTKPKAATQAAVDPALDPQVATAPATQSANQAPAAEPAPGTELTFISTPDGADVELDGAFVGSAPSTISVANGDHVIRITKKGYQPYEKTLRTSGGTVSLRADLDLAGQ
jgi:hypothetical protein